MLRKLSVILGIVLVAHLLTSSPTRVSCQRELETAASDLSVAESVVAGGDAKGIVLDKSGFKSGGDAGFKSGAAGTTGFGAKAAVMKGLAKDAKDAAGGFKKGGKKAGFASGAGYSSKFGKKGGKFGSFVAGRKKTYGTIKSFNHDSAFKFGKVALYGEMGKDTKILEGKKGLMGAAGDAGFKKGAKGGAKSFVFADAYGLADKKAATGSAGFKKGGAFGDKKVILTGKGGTGGILV